jgi:hypothetical protein
MKKILLTSLIATSCFLPSLVFAQQEKQVSDTTGYSAIIPINKQNLLKNIDVIANMQYNFRNDFQDGKFQDSRFRMEQFRFEIKGNVTDKVYFRLRQRYTSELQPQSVDKLTRATDLAFIRIDASPKVSLSFGKVCADWGGYEFDYNPIEIYEYSDIIEQADNFLSGAGVAYRPNTGNELTFQVLNSRTKSFEELYGNPPGKTESKVPLAFVGNWRGSLFNHLINTIWSYSIFTEAESTFMNYLALGNQLKLKKFSLEYDFKLSGEGLDRTGIVSATIPDSLYNYAVEKTLYSSHWLKADYRVSKKVNLAFVGFVDFAKWRDDIDAQKDEDKIRTAWGFVPSVEYYPFDKLNLKFFVNYVGRIYNYSDYAKKRFGASDYNTGRFCIGFITPLLIL